MTINYKTLNQIVKKDNTSTLIYSGSDITYKGSRTTFEIKEIINEI